MNRAPAALLLSALLLSACGRAGSQSAVAPGTTADAAVRGVASVAVGTAATPPSYLTINSGGPDAGGFGADTDFDGTSSTGTDPVKVDVSGPNTAPAVIFATYRTAPQTLTYAIPGLYADAAYHGFLFFEEPLLTGPGQRLLDVSAGGTAIASSLDIFATAGKMHKAIGVAFNATSDPTGTLDISIAARKNSAIISGLKMYGPPIPSGPPATPGPPMPFNGSLFVNAGGAAVSGFGADTYWSDPNSTPGIDMAAVDVSGPNTAPATIFSTYRTGGTPFSPLGYTIPGLLANTAYHGFLFFEEPVYNAPNQRLMLVTVNGTPVPGFGDIYSLAGAMHKAIGVPYAAISDATGTLQIDLTPSEFTFEAPAIISGFKVWGPAGPRATASVTSYTAGITGVPQQLTAGPDGNVWFTETAGSAGLIGRITPAGNVTEFSSGLTGVPQSITAGPDGNVWFTESNGVGRITPSGAVTEFHVGVTFGGPTAITAGPDGNVWFGELYGSIDRLTPSGTLTQFPGAGDVSSMTVGRDGNIWLVASRPPNVQSTLSRITTSGNLTTLPLDLGFSTSITSGPDGNLWLNSLFIADIAHASSPAEVNRVTPSGVLTQFNLIGYGGPSSLVFGRDGNLWFTGGPGVTRMTTAGVGSAAFAQAEALTSGPDGNIWLIEPSGAIGKLVP